MSIYKYRAKNFSGKELNGEMEAPDVATVTLKLRADGFVLLDVTQTAGEGIIKKSAGVSVPLMERLNKIGGSLNFLNRVKLQDKMIFTRNLAVMVGAGLTVSRALHALQQEAKNPYFKKVINDINDRVTKGQPLRDAFAASPDVFPELYVSMVQAGEESGKLEESLNVLAKQMKADHELISRVKGAMMYPIIVVIVMFSVGIAMMIYVIPILMQTFLELNVELPATTRGVLAVSNFLRRFGLVLLAALPFALYGLRQYKRSPSGKKIFDLFIINMPLIGPINKKFNTARAARTLSSLLSSGVAVGAALDITGHVLQNHFFGDVLIEAQEKIQKGGKMSESFAAHPNLFSSLLAEMIAVGEETGKTSDMLGEVADFYEEEVQQVTKDLSGIVEPILMVVIGIAVAIFALSVIQPLYGIINVI
ncbi:MAG: type II secretion system F family protein [Patescibacteria group bacterium]